MLQPGDRGVGDASTDVGKPDLRIDVSMSLSLAVMISVAMKAARSAPRSEPAKSHDLRPRAKPNSARSAALFVRQIRPSLRKAVNPSQRLIM